MSEHESEHESAPAAAPPSFRADASPPVVAIAGARNALVVAAVLSGAAALALQLAPYRSMLASLATLAATTAAMVCAALALWIARRVHGAARDSAVATDRALCELTRRDALLAETEARLDAAEGARQRGRLSDQQVDQYTVAELIGRGGGGEVYKAWDESLRAHVAVKVLHEARQGDAESLERFFREARACSDLDSPHIVKVLGAGRTADGAPYLAMELLDGCDLATYLRELDQLSIGETVEIVTQVGRALHTAHQAGVIHRDVKPRNLFRTMRDGHAHWKVLDFGVSKNTLTEVTALTGTGTVLGTPGFMAPEQALGRELDARADVFSLGVVAYRCLTGQPAFVGYDAHSAMRAVALEPPVSPVEIVWMPHKVELVLAMALQKERRHRCSSARELAEALAAAAAGQLPESFRERGEAALARQPWAERDPGSLAAASARVPGSRGLAPRSHTTIIAAAEPD